MSGPFSRRSVRGLASRNHSTIYLEPAVVVWGALLGLVVWLVLLFPMPRGTHGFFTKWGMESYILHTLVGLQFVAGVLGIVRKRIERDGDLVKVRRSTVGVLPRRMREGDVVRDDAGAPLTIAATIEARASATFTQHNTYLTFEGGRRVPTTETVTKTMDCTIDGLFRRVGQHRVPFAGEKTYSVGELGEMLIRMSAVDPWPCFEVEYRDGINTRQTIVRFEPSRGDDPNKFDLIVSSIFRRAEQASLVELRLERGWLDIPHALWTPVEGFPETEVAGGPFRQRSGASADLWEWTMTEDEARQTRRVGPFRDSWETSPERVVVRDGWLFAKEAGSGQVGSIPLATLREAKSASETISTFRFGRATDVVLPKDSEAARRLRARLGVGDGRAEAVEATTGPRRDAVSRR